ncbi:helix-turn-helix domain-containing protein [Micromonospora sp. RTGN7]|uniref:helix-turn-helix domain-containing protein n=1 Tax=Micromonospora sp. RTGN7 TaxID=3016526 RepID=UPI0029FF1C5A|nr:helix-turn-helix domain-containing protein [Micromonospora sp. RTGN7]
MSLAVKAALLASKDLRGTDRLVVLAIAAHTNTAGDAWPAVATIAEYVGVSERTIQRSLARLVQAGRLAVRQVSGIATRVYRIVSDIVAAAVERVTSKGRGVTPQGAGVPDSAARGDSQNGTVSPDVDGGEKGKGRAGAQNWRNWVPKSKKSGGWQPYPERRGAALPPPPGGDRCQKPGHGGQIIGRCGPCRGEALAGGVR